MSPEPQIHHPEGVSEKDKQYRDDVKERIITGTVQPKSSAVTVFANHLGDLGIRFQSFGPGGAKYSCGCQVEFAQEVVVTVCEGHR